MKLFRTYSVLFTALLLLSARVFAQDPVYVYDHGHVYETVRQLVGNLSERAHLSYEFDLIATDDANIVVQKGNQADVKISITKGMVEAFASEDAGALAYVVAYELNIFTRGVTPSYPNFPGKRSKENFFKPELSSWEESDKVDEDSIQLLMKAGYNPKQALAALEILYQTRLSSSQNSAIKLNRIFTSHPYLEGLAHNNFKSYVEVMNALLKQALKGNQNQFQEQPLGITQAELDKMQIFANEISLVESNKPDDALRSLRKTITDLRNSTDDFQFNLTGPINKLNAAILQKIDLWNLTQTEELSFVFDMFFEEWGDHFWFDQHKTNFPVKRLFEVEREKFDGVLEKYKTNCEIRYQTSVEQHYLTYMRKNYPWMSTDLPWNENVVYLEGNVFGTYAKPPHLWNALLQKNSDQISNRQSFDTFIGLLKPNHLLGANKISLDSKRYLLTRAFQLRVQPHEFEALFPKNFFEVDDKEVFDAQDVMTKRKAVIKDWFKHHVASLTSDRAPTMATLRLLYMLDFVGSLVGDHTTWFGNFESDLMGEIAAVPGTHEALVQYHLFDQNNKLMSKLDQSKLKEVVDLKNDLKKYYLEKKRPNEQQITTDDYEQFHHSVKSRSLDWIKDNLPKWVVAYLFDGVILKTDQQIINTVLLHNLEHPDDQIHSQADFERLAGKYNYFLDTKSQFPMQIAFERLHPTVQDLSNFIEDQVKKQRVGKAVDSFLREILDDEVKSEIWDRFLVKLGIDQLPRTDEKLDWFYRTAYFVHSHGKLGTRPKFQLVAAFRNLLVQKFPEAAQAEDFFKLYKEMTDNNVLGEENSNSDKSRVTEKNFVEKYFSWFLPTKEEKLLKYMDKNQFHEFDQLMKDRSFEISTQTQVKILAKATAKAIAYHQYKFLESLTFTNRVDMNLPDELGRSNVVIVALAGDDRALKAFLDVPEVKLNIQSPIDFTDIFSPLYASVATYKTLMSAIYKVARETPKNKKSVNEFSKIDFNILLENTRNNFDARKHRSNLSRLLSEPTSRMDPDFRIKGRQPSNTGTALEVLNKQIEIQETNVPITMGLYETVVNDQNKKIDRLLQGTVLLSKNNNRPDVEDYVRRKILQSGKPQEILPVNYSGVIEDYERKIFVDLDNTAKDGGEKGSPEEVIKLAHTGVDPQTKEELLDLAPIENNEKSASFPVGRSKDNFLKTAYNMTLGAVVEKVSSVFDAGHKLWTLSTLGQGNGFLPNITRIIESENAWWKNWFKRKPKTEQNDQATTKAKLRIQSTVKLNGDGTIATQPKEITTDAEIKRKNKQFIADAKNGNEEGIRTLLNDPDIKSDTKERALHQAISNDQLDIIPIFELDENLKEAFAKELDGLVGEYHSRTFRSKLKTIGVVRDCVTPDQVQMIARKHALMHDDVRKILNSPLGTFVSSVSKIANAEIQNTYDLKYSDRPNAKTEDGEFSILSLLGYEPTLKSENAGEKIENSHETHTFQYDLSEIKKNRENLRTHKIARVLKDLGLIKDNLTVTEYNFVLDYLKTDNIYVPETKGSISYLHYACEHGFHPRIIRMLVDHGFNMNKLNASGHSPFALWMDSFQKTYKNDPVRREFFYKTLHYLNTHHKITMNANLLPTTGLYAVYLAQKIPDRKDRKPILKELGIKDYGYTNELIQHIHDSFDNYNVLDYDKMIRLVQSGTVDIFDSYFDLDGKETDISVLGKIIKIYENKRFYGGAIRSEESSIADLILAAFEQNPYPEINPMRFSELQRIRKSSFGFDSEVNIDDGYENRKHDFSQKSELFYHYIKLKPVEFLKNDLILHTFIYLARQMPKEHLQECIKKILEIDSRQEKERIFNTFANITESSRNTYNRTLVNQAVYAGVDVALLRKMHEAGADFTIQNDHYIGHETGTREHIEAHAKNHHIDVVLNTTYKVSDKENAKATLRFLINELHLTPSQSLKDKYLQIFTFELADLGFDPKEIKLLAGNIIKKQAVENNEQLADLKVVNQKIDEFYSAQKTQIGVKLNSALVSQKLLEESAKYSVEEIGEFVAEIRNDPKKAPVWDAILEQLKIKSDDHFTEINDPKVKKFYQMGLYVHTHEDRGSEAKKILVLEFWKEVLRDFDSRITDSNALTENMKLATSDEAGIYIFGEEPKIANTSQSFNKNSRQENSFYKNLINRYKKYMVEHYGSTAEKLVYAIQQNDYERFKNLFKYSGHLLSEKERTDILESAIEPTKGRFLDLVLQERRFELNVLPAVLDNKTSYMDSQVAELLNQKAATISNEKLKNDILISLNPEDFPLPENSDNLSFAQARQKLKVESVKYTDAQLKEFINENTLSAKKATYWTDLLVQLKIVKGAGFFDAVTRSNEEKIKFDQYNQMMDRMNDPKVRKFYQWGLYVHEHGAPGSQTKESLVQAFFKEFSTDFKSEISNQTLAKAVFKKTIDKDVMIFGKPFVSNFKESELQMFVSRGAEIEKVKELFKVYSSNPEALTEAFEHIINSYGADGSNRLEMLKALFEVPGLPLDKIEKVVLKKAANEPEHLHVKMLEIALPHFSAITAKNIRFVMAASKGEEKTILEGINDPEIKKDILRGAMTDAINNEKYNIIHILGDLPAVKSVLFNKLMEAKSNSRHDDNSKLVSALVEHMTIAAVKSVLSSKDGPGMSGEMDEILTNAIAQKKSQKEPKKYVATNENNKKYDTPERIKAWVTAFNENPANAQKITEFLGVAGAKTWSEIALPAGAPGYNHVKSVYEKAGIKPQQHLFTNQVSTEVLLKAMMYEIDRHPYSEDEILEFEIENQNNAKKTVAWNELLDVLKIREISNQKAEYYFNQLGLLVHNTGNVQAPADKITETKVAYLQAFKSWMLETFRNEIGANQNRFLAAFSETISPQVKIYGHDGGPVAIGLNLPYPKPSDYLDEWGQRLGDLGKNVKDKLGKTWNRLREKLGYKIPRLGKGGDAKKNKKMESLETEVQASGNGNGGASGSNQKSEAALQRKQMREQASLEIERQIKEHGKYSAEEVISFINEIKNNPNKHDVWDELLDVLEINDFSETIDHRIDDFFQLSLYVHNHGNPTVKGERITIEKIKLLQYFKDWIEKTFEHEIGKNKNEFTNIFRRTYSKDVAIYGKLVPINEFSQNFRAENPEIAAAFDDYREVTNLPLNQEVWDAERLSREDVVKNEPVASTADVEEHELSPVVEANPIERRAPAISLEEYEQMINDWNAAHSDQQIRTPEDMKTYLSDHDRHVLSSFDEACKKQKINPGRFFVLRMLRKAHPEYNLDLARSIEWLNDEINLYRSPKNSSNIISNTHLLYEWLLPRFQYRHLYGKQNPVITNEEITSAFTKYVKPEEVEPSMHLKTLLSIEDMAEEIKTNAREHPYSWTEISKYIRETKEIPVKKDIWNDLLHILQIDHSSEHSLRMLSDIYSFAHPDLADEFRINQRLDQMDQKRWEFYQYALYVHKHEEIGTGAKFRLVAAFRKIIETEYPYVVATEEFRKVFKQATDNKIFGEEDGVLIADDVQDPAIENFKKYKGHLKGTATGQKFTDEGVVLSDPKPLYDSQLPYFDKILDHYIAGNREGFIVAPKGVGKTVFLSKLLEAYDPSSKRPIYVLEETNVMVNQTYEEIHRFTNLPREAVGRVGNKLMETGRPVTVMTYASFVRLTQEGKIKPSADAMLIYDEAHRGLSELRSSISKVWDAARKFGVTASDKFSEIKQVANVLYNEIFRLSVPEAIESDMLASTKVVGLEFNKVDVAKADKGNDAIDHEMMEKILREGRVTSVAIKAYKEYLPLTNAPLAVVNCVDINDAEATAEEFNKAGIKAYALHGGNAQFPREASPYEITKQFSENKSPYKVLMLVNMGEGLDFPDVGLVINKALTYSEVVNIQRNLSTRKSERFPDKQSIVLELIYANSKRQSNGKPLQKIYSEVIEGEERYPDPTSPFKKSSSIFALAQNSIETYTGKDVRVVTAEELARVSTPRQSLNMWPLERITEVIDTWNNANPDRKIIDSPTYKKYRVEAKLPRYETFYGYCAKAKITANEYFGKQRHDSQKWAGWNLAKVREVREQWNQKNPKKQITDTKTHDLYAGEARIPGLSMLGKMASLENTTVSEFYGKEKFDIKKYKDWTLDRVETVIIAWNEAHADKQIDSRQTYLAYREEAGLPPIQRFAYVCTQAGKTVNEYFGKEKQTHKWTDWTLEKIESTRQIWNAENKEKQIESLATYKKYWNEAGLIPPDTFKDLCEKDGKTTNEFFGKPRQEGRPRTEKALALIEKIKTKNKGKTFSIVHPVQLLFMPNGPLFRLAAGLYELYARSMDAIANNLEMWRERFNAPEIEPLKTLHADDLNSKPESNPVSTESSGAIKASDAVAATEPSPEEPQVSGDGSSSDPDDKENEIKRSDEFAETETIVSGKMMKSRINADGELEVEHKTGTEKPRWWTLDDVKERLDQYNSTAQADKKITGIKSLDVLSYQAGLPNRTKIQALIKDSKRDRYWLFSKVSADYSLKDRIQKYKESTGKDPVVYKGQIWTAKKIKIIKNAYNETVSDDQKITGTKSYDKYRVEAGLPERRMVDVILDHDSQERDWFYDDSGESYDLNFEIQKFKIFNPGKDPFIYKNKIWTATYLKELLEVYNNTAPDGEKIKTWRAWDKFYTRAGLVDRTRAVAILDIDGVNLEWVVGKVSDGYIVKKEIAVIKSLNGGREPIVSKGQAWTAKLMKLILDHYNKTVPEEEKIISWRTWDKFSSKARLPERDLARKIIELDQYIDPAYQLKSGMFVPMVTGNTEFISEDAPAGITVTTKPEESTGKPGTLYTVIGLPISPSLFAPNGLIARTFTGVTQKISDAYKSFVTTPRAKSRIITPQGQMGPEQELGGIIADLKGQDGGSELPPEDKKRIEELTKNLRDQGPSFRKRMIEQVAGAAVELPKSFGTFFCSLTLAHLWEATHDHSIGSDTFIDIVKGLPMEFVRFTTFSAGASVGSGVAQIGFGLKDMLVEKMFQQQGAQAVKEIQSIQGIRQTVIGLTSPRAYVKSQMGMLAGTILNLIIHSREMTTNEMLLSAFQTQLSFMIAGAVVRGVAVRVVEGVAVSIGEQLLARGFTIMKWAYRGSKCFGIVGIVVTAAEFVVADPINRWFNKVQKNSEAWAAAYENLFKLEYWLNGQPIPQMRLKDICIQEKDQMKQGACYAQAAIASLQMYASQMSYWPVNAVTMKYQEKQIKVDQSHGSLSQLSEADRDETEWGRGVPIKTGPIGQFEYINENKNLWATYTSAADEAYKEVRDEISSEYKSVFEELQNGYPACDDSQLESCGKMIKKESNDRAAQLKALADRINEQTQNQRWQLWLQTRTEKVLGFNNNVISFDFKNLNEWAEMALYSAKRLGRIEISDPTKIMVQQYFASQIVSAVGSELLVGSPVVRTVAQNNQRNESGTLLHSFWKDARGYGQWWRIFSLKYDPKTPFISTGVATQVKSLPAYPQLPRDIKDKQAWANYTKAMNAYQFAVESNQGVQERTKITRDMELAKKYSYELFSKNTLSLITPRGIEKYGNRKEKLLMDLGHYYACTWSKKVRRDFVSSYLNDSRMFEKSENYLAQQDKYFKQKNEKLKNATYRLPTDQEWEDYQSGQDKEFEEKIPMMFIQVFDQVENVDRFSQEPLIQFKEVVGVTSEMLAQYGSYTTCQ